jgi:hypothetical protein
MKIGIEREDLTGVEFLRETNETGISKIDVVIANAAERLMENGI